MDYQIINANADIGQIEVLYKQNGVHLAVYAIDVPIIDGAYLTGEALHAEIMHRAPTWVTTRQRETMTALGFDEIQALVKPLEIPEVSADAKANEEMWEQVAYEQKLAKALVKFGLLESDPTEIGVTKL